MSSTTRRRQRRIDAASPMWVMLTSSLTWQQRALMVLFDKAERRLKFVLRITLTLKARGLSKAGAAAASWAAKVAAQLWPSLLLVFREQNVAISFHPSSSQTILWWVTSPIYRTRSFMSELHQSLWDASLAGKHRVLNTATTNPYLPQLTVGQYLGSKRSRKCSNSSLMETCSAYGAQRSWIGRSRGFG